MDDSLVKKVATLIHSIIELIPYGGTFSYVSSNGMSFNAIADSDCYYGHSGIIVHFNGGLSSGFTICGYKNKSHDFGLSFYRELVRNNFNHHKVERHYFLKDDVDKMLLCLDLLEKGGMYHEAQ